MVSEHYVDVLQAGLMAAFLEWLRRGPGLVLDGADGIAGFNHPGREPRWVGARGADGLAAAGGLR